MSLLSQALSCLDTAATRTRYAWPLTTWRQVAGTGPDSIILDGKTPFTYQLQFRPNEEVILQCDLDVPAELAGIDVTDDSLEVVISSLYPIEMYIDDTCIFADHTPPVASGPALVEVLPHLRSGNNGLLSIRFRTPNHQTFPWFNLYFTTPRLRSRFELLDTLFAELTLADTFANSDEERALVEQAAAFLPKHLVPCDEETLQDTLGSIEHILTPLASSIQQRSVHLIGHSHIDMNWLWTWPDTVEVIKRDFRSVLALMDDYPELTFTHSQPVTYQLIESLEPELFARVKQRIHEGRWEAATMTWVENDTNMSSGEAMIRQLLEGVTYSREHLGVQPRSFWAPDTFGNAGNLPQLAVSAGATQYYHHRCNPNGVDAWPAYWWQGDDGTRMLGIGFPNYNGEIRASFIARAVLHAHRHGLTTSLLLHGIGDHGGGPTKLQLETLRRLQQRSLLPRMYCSTVERYVQELLDGESQLPTHSGESPTIFEGCYTSHVDAKCYNRTGENQLTTADTLAVLAQLEDGHKALRSAWRKLLFNQFHDILDGSAIHETYQKTADDFAEIQHVADTVTARALGAFEQDLQVGTIAITNSLSWEREDWVIVAGEMPPTLGWRADQVVAGQPVELVSDQGHRTFGQWTAEGLGFVARVPAFSTVSYRIIQEEKELFPPALEALPCYAPADPRSHDPSAAPSLGGGGVSKDPPYFLIETEHFRLYMRRDSGIIVSCLDKRVNRELVGFGMRRIHDYLDSARTDLALNVFQLVEELPHGMGAWHLDEVHSEQSFLRNAQVTVVESGPVRLVIEVQHMVRSSHITQRISFYHSLPRIDFHTHLDWREEGNWKVGIPNIKIAFTARLPQNEAWFETPFAAVRRPSDGQEVPALRWADVGGDSYGFALLNDSKYGYDALGGRLRLTLVRSGYIPDAIADIGVHNVRYSFVPHPGNWRQAGIVRQAAGFNHPLLARYVPPRVTTSPSVVPLSWRPSLTGDPSVLIVGMKFAQSGRGRIIRLYECHGCDATVTLSGLPSHARIWETNVIEDRQHEINVEEGNVTLTFRPWQVRTLSVETL